MCLSSQIYTSIHTHTQHTQGKGACRRSTFVIHTCIHTHIHVQTARGLRVINIRHTYMHAYIHAHMYRQPEACGQSTFVIHTYIHATYTHTCTDSQRLAGDQHSSYIHAYIHTYMYRQPEACGRSTCASRHITMTS
jgi:hypothetical protein